MPRFWNVECGTCDWNGVELPPIAKTIGPCEDQTRCIAGGQKSDAGCEQSRAWSRAQDIARWEWIGVFNILDEIWKVCRSRQEVRGNPLLDVDRHVESKLSRTLEPFGFHEPKIDLWFAR